MTFVLKAGLALANPYTGKSQQAFLHPTVITQLLGPDRGIVRCRLHLLTKHRVFSGPGFQVAIEVGDAANGGQVLLTHDAWLRLEPEMSQAGFPTVKQIGLYQLKSWPSPIWVYEVLPLAVPIPMDLHASCSTESCRY